MDADGRVSLREAAARLGVHYQTVYRWVRRGELPAVKVSGVYEVEPDAIEAFALSRAQPAPPPAQRRVRTWTPFAERLHAALVVGDELAARELLGDLTGGGVGLVSICDHVMVPALIRIGQEWMDGQISVAEEHRASAICERILGRLSPAPPGRPRGTAVVCSPAGDEHHLPGEMATAVLREDHWRVHHLGTGVPFPDVERLVVAEAADLVVISVTWPPALPQSRAMAEALAAPGRRVLAGRPGMSLAALVEGARQGRPG